MLHLSEDKGLLLRGQLLRSLVRDLHPRTHPAAASTSPEHQCPFWPQGGRPLLRATRARARGSVSIRRSDRGILQHHSLSKGIVA